MSDSRLHNMHSPLHVPGAVPTNDALDDAKMELARLKREIAQAGRDLQALDMQQEIAQAREQLASLNAELAKRK